MDCTVDRVVARDRAGGADCQCTHGRRGRGALAAAVSRRRSRHDRESAVRVQQRSSMSSSTTWVRLYRSESAWWTG